MAKLVATTRLLLHTEGRSRTIEPDDEFEVDDDFADRLVADGVAETPSKGKSSSGSSSKGE